MVIDNVKRDFYANYIKLNQNKLKVQRLIVIFLLFK